jgi:4-amino-4-deoxy-L-arabinose transferase-like glycosyltransferase
MPEEPSILDYLKSKLRFWERTEKEKISSVPELSVQSPLDTSSMDELEKAGLPAGQAPLEASTVLEPETAVLPDGQVPLETSSVAEMEPAGLPQGQGALPEPPQKKVAGPTHWPWRSILALAIALLAQRAWEPAPGQKALSGLILYAFSLALLVWAYFSHEWTLATVPETGRGSETMQVRRLPLVLGILLSLVAFITLGHNLFTLSNVTVWILAITCFIWTFWLPGEESPSFWMRLKTFFTRDAWQIKITRWALLLLVVAAVIAFFRLSALNGVPSQPGSDHAESILDVFDVSNGQAHIFFPRNSGREPIQMYLTLVVSWLFGTGLSFLSLKMSAVICGLATLPYLYLLGKEFGGKRIGLLAVFFTGIAYWPNVISRFGMSFPLYPLFVAPTLYYLIRGLRTRSRNDFILSGLFLGFGMYGYTPFRIVPLVVAIAVGLNLLHAQSTGSRKQAAVWLAILAIVSFVVFLPLMRYWLDNPNDFSTRVFSRMGSIEAPLPGPAWQIILSNTWNALRMFNWNDGETAVHSVVYRPALDVVSGALFILGITLLLIRYIRKRHWLDLFLLLAIPLLELPSILSLAFPKENPVLTFTGGALVPVFLIVAMALDGLLAGISSRMNRRLGTALAWVLVLFLAVWSSLQNYDLVFRQYADQYTGSAWNSSEMGQIIKQSKQTFGTTDTVWIVAFPYWVDTRLPGVWAGIPNRDFAVWPQDFSKTLDVKGTKLFMIKPEDTQDVNALRQLYPQGSLSTFHSAIQAEGKNFLILFVPSNE